MRHIVYKAVNLNHFFSLRKYGFKTNDTTNEPINQLLTSNDSFVTFAFRAKVYYGSMTFLI